MVFHSLVDRSDNMIPRIANFHSMEQPERDILPEPTNNATLAEHLMACAKEHRM